MKSDMPPSSLTPEQHDARWKAQFANPIYFPPATADELAAAEAMTDDEMESILESAKKTRASIRTDARSI